MPTQDTGPDRPESIRAILNALPAMVGYWDHDLRNVMANDAYTRFFGKQPEEIRGMRIAELLGPELYERSRPDIEAALAGESREFDREISTPSGEVRFVQASYIPDVVDEAVRGFFVLASDVTERKRIEDEVERRGARLAEAEQVARMGSWEWDISSNEVTWSAGLFAIYGISPDEFEGRYQPSSERVHPNDRDRMDDAVRRALERCEPIDADYRIIRPDGRVRRLHARAEVITDADGKPLRFVGIAQDVTEVRSTAEALHQTAADLGRRAAELHSLTQPANHSGEGIEGTLTPRQIEILSLVSDGLSNAEIGDRLFLAESTIKWHVGKILRALGVANRAQAVSRYLSSQSRPD
ncbi:MAG TPA: PAS domain-containing protein [Baekduia sp.]|nr:PAS domain-containing protein [Baekduia sp.]